MFDFEYNPGEKTLGTEKELIKTFAGNINNAKMYINTWRQAMEDKLKHDRAYNYYAPENSRASNSVFRFAFNFCCAGELSK